MSEHKMELTILVDNNDELQIGLKNPGNIPLMKIAGIIDFVKFNLHTDIARAMVPQAVVTSEGE